MTERTIVKNFNNFSGRDVRSSDLIRSLNYAIEFKNARVVAEDSCVNREGFHIRGNSAQYEGLYTYRYSDLTTGETIEEKISLSDNLYKKSNYTLTVVYSGSTVPVYLSIALNTTSATYKCTIIEGTTTKLNYDLGTGLEASPVTLANLKTQIDAISGGNFAATIVGDTSFPAAFLPITLYADLAVSPKTQVLTFFGYTKMSTLTSAVFSSYHSNRGLDSWELASIANAENCLFIATGYEYLQVYDGQNVYRAGMPFAETAIQTALGAAGGFTDTDVKYIYVYKQVDNRGNIILGIESDPSDELSPAGEKVTLTIPNILAASGFNTGCAIVNGAQALVTTITTDSANTFKVGDTAYFWDRSDSAGWGSFHWGVDPWGSPRGYIERVITARTATTITIAGAAVTVADDDVISNNLRIVIYRNIAGGRLFYEVGELPNNSFTATQTYTDSLGPTDLNGVQYIPPIKERGLLDAKPRYLRMHQDLLIASGAPALPNAWFHSNGEGPWYFAEDESFEEVKNTSGGGVKGIGSNQEHLVIGTDRSLFVVTGDVDSGAARQEKLGERNIGFACHNSIVDIGGPIAFLSKVGFWMIENGFNLIEIGEPINPIFDTTGVPATSQFQLKRAYAVHFEETQEYICFLPCESGSGTSKYANSNSTVQVYNTARDKGWSEWTGLNMGGGLTIFEDNLWFQSKRSDSVLTVTGNLWRRNTLGKVDDYADHTTAIDWVYGPQWLDGGEPSVFKVFLWIKVYNLLKQLLLAAFDLNVKVERNLQRDVTWAEFDLDFGPGMSSIGWGLFPWGLSPWGTPRQVSIKKKLGNKTQSMRFIFSNSELHQKVAISAFEVVVTNPYKVELVD